MRPLVEVARGHPRHLLLGAVVAGLLAGRVPGLAVAVAAVAAVVAARPPLALAAAACVLGGGLVSDLRLQALDRTVLASRIDRPLAVTGVLLEPPRRAASGSRSALLALTGRPGRGERVVARTRRGVRWPTDRVGAEVAAAGRLVALGRFDSHQRRRGAHAVLLTRGVRATGRRRGGLAGWLDGVRERAEHAVSAGLAPEQAALARGMVLGEDDRLSDAQRDDFRASGLAHLLAASGQNVMLLAALVIFAVAALGGGLRARLACALAAIAAYVPLAGAGPSIQRAGVMGAAGILAALASRPASRTYALLLAAAVTLTLNPRAAGDPGWQLSFGAVVAILTLSAGVRDRLVARGLVAPVAEAAAITAAATLGTAPLLAFHFGRVSLVSLPANLIAAAAVAPVMWLGMAAIAAGAVAPGLAAAVNLVTRLPLAFVGAVAQVTAGLPSASLSLRIGSVVALLAVYALVAAAALRPRARGPVAVLGTAALLGGGLGAATAPAAPDPRTLRVSFLDIGQGDATLAQHGGATILVDTGPPDAPLLRRLREAGVRRIDLFVITHAQADHEGGAPALLRAMPVGLMLDGGHDTPTGPHAEIATGAARRRVERVAPDAGQVLRAGPMTLQVLSPRAEPPDRHAGQDPNQRAIVAVLRDGAFSMLLTADAESDVTTPLDLPPVDVLKVAHHGSDDPGLSDELRRLRPRLAVIEVGRHNTFGHPRPSTLAALRTAVPEIRRTDRDGTVVLTVKAGRLKVTSNGPD